MKAAYGTTAARMAESLAADDGVASENEHNLDAIEADDVHQMAEQPSLINLVNLVLLGGDPVAHQRRPRRAVRRRAQGEVPDRRRAPGAALAAEAPAGRTGGPNQDHGPHEHRRAIRPAGRAHLAAIRRPKGGYPSLDRADALRRIGGHENPRQVVPPARSQEPGYGRAGSRDDGPADREAPRAGAGHRPDRFGQDDDACTPGSANSTTRARRSSRSKIPSSTNSAASTRSR